MTVKIVINAQHGGFHLSPAQESIFGSDYPESTSAAIRLDPRLVESVEAGDHGGTSCELAVIEIPDGAKYVFGEHAGYEWIHWSMSEIHTERP